MVLSVWTSFAKDMENANQLFSDYAYGAYFNARCKSKNSPDKTKHLFNAQKFAQMGAFQKMAYYYTKLLYHNEAIDDFTILNSQSALRDQNFTGQVPSYRENDKTLTNTLQHDLYAVQTCLSDMGRDTRKNMEKPVSTVIIERRIITDINDNLERSDNLLKLEHLSAYNAYCSIYFKMHGTKNPDAQSVLNAQFREIESYFKANDFSLFRDKLPIGTTVLEQAAANLAENAYLLKQLRPQTLDDRRN